MTEIDFWLTLPSNWLQTAEDGQPLIPRFFSAIDYPEVGLGMPWLQGLLIIALVAFNGFFVAAEVALIKLRSAQLENSNIKDLNSAQITRHVLENLDRYVPACKFGNSISGLLLGLVSIPFLAGQIAPLLGTLGIQSGRAITNIAFFLAFTLVLSFVVVMGKVVPNSIGFRRELEVSMRCSRPLHWFYLLFFPPIWILTAFANWFLESILRIKPAAEREILHSAEDIRILVEETDEEHVSETEKEILINALELNDLTVRDIVTPRNEVVSLDINDPFEINLQKAVSSRHTRFPLINEHLDDTLGQIHIKDLIQVIQTPNPDLRQVRRDILRVDESVRLDQMLKIFLNNSAHLALVVDDYGGSHGLVTLDALLELLVGEIQDEFDVDEEEEPFHWVSDDEFIVAAYMPLHELDDLVPELDLESPDVSTVGGYVTTVLGHHPKVGETTVIEGFQVKVTQADERKIRELRFSRIVPDDLAPRQSEKMAAGI